MKIKTLLVSILERTRTGSFLVATRQLCKRESHLRQAGWFESFAHRMPLDATGQPLPWYPYPAIKFLEGRLHSSMRVFEFGSGNSTLWWSARVGSVVSCEHDRQWYEHMRTRLPHNVTYEFADRAPAGNYEDRAARFSNEFDIILIDGRDRVQCAMKSVASLKRDGVIVWDNSDRVEYLEGYNFLLDSGFKRLDFWGIGPINSYESCNSIFYRTHNCFGI
jgi:hypothetical protein